MSAKFDRDRLSQLVALMCDDLIDDEQFIELELILNYSQTARKWYHVYIRLHQDFERDAPLPDSASIDDAKINDAEIDGAAIRSESLPTPTTSSAPQRTAAWALVASVAAAATLFLAYQSWIAREPSVRNSGAFVATITHAVDANWDGAKLKLNDLVKPGRLRLKSGLVRLQFRQNVVLSLMGPAEYEILSTSHTILKSGRLAAYVPPGAEGFRVDTPNAQLTDLGTEFGVTVGNEETELSVFDGQVEMRPSQANATSRIIESGHTVRIDRAGNAQSFALAPYQRARDALRRFQIVWEPFGPGSSTGKFPGKIGGGWKSPWRIEAKNGETLKRHSTVANEQTLYPGAEFYLTLGGRPTKDTDKVILKAARDFGPIDQFTTTKPYTIELLIRLESDPSAIENMRLFSKPKKLRLREDEGAPTWQLLANRSNPSGELSWQLPVPGEGNNRQLVADWWKTYRFLVEVNPQRGTWRTTIANRQQSITNELTDAIDLFNAAESDMTLCFEATGKTGKAVRFSLDEIRIQNHPDTVSKTAK